MNSFKNGFFYSCGKALFYLFLIIIISLIFQVFKFDLKDALMIDRVDAYTYSGWAEDLKVNEHIYGWYANEEFKLHTPGYSYLDQTVYRYIASVDKQTLRSWGLGFVVNKTINSSHRYNVMYQVCLDAEPDADTWYYYGPKADIFAKKNKEFINPFQNRTQLDGDPLALSSGAPTYKYCYQENLSFTAKDNANFFGILMRRTSSAAQTHIALFYLNIEDTGVDTSYISSQVNMLMNSINSLDSKISNQTNTMNSNSQAEISNANSNQAQTNSNLNKINDSINDDSVDGTNDLTNEFFGDDVFKDETGILAIVSVPFDFINGLTSNTCNPLSFPLPFVEQNVTLPCMRQIYKTYFNDFYTVYQILTTGIICYFCVVHNMRTIQKVIDPTNSTVEVIEL